MVCEYWFIDFEMLSSSISGGVWLMGWWYFYLVYLLLVCIVWWVVVCRFGWCLCEVVLSWCVCFCVRCMCWWWIMCCSVCYLVVLSVLKLCVCKVLLVENVSGVMMLWCLLFGLGVGGRLVDG